jgi:adenylate kinase family enzyme
MEQSTDRRARLAEKLRSGGLAVAESGTRRARLQEKLQAHREEFSLKKIPQAAAVGTLGMASDAVLGAGVQGQRALDSAGAAGRHLVPGQLTRTDRPGVAMSASNGLELHSGVRASILPPGDKQPIDAPEGAGFRESHKPDEKQVIAAAARVADQIQQAAAEIGYVPSRGFAASVVEGAAQSAPHFAGGIGASVAGGAVGGPVGAAAAGAAYFGASEGLTHTADVYKRMIEEGATQNEAIQTASNSGVLYAGASGLLEYAGVRSIMSGTRWGKALDKASTNPRWLQAAANTARAGAGEGTTEVLQGVVGEALASMALEDWDEFKAKYTESDEPAKEFLSAMLLGGGVRGAGEVLNPANYKSLTEWKKASGAPLNPSVSIAEGLGVESGDAAETSGQTENEEGAEGVQVSAPLPADNRHGEPVSQGTHREVLGVRTGVDAEQSVQRFLQANGTTGAAVEAETDQQRLIQQDAAKRGITVQYVRGDSQLQRPGANPEPGLILLDADATPGRQLDALAWHETVHEIEKQNPGAWMQLQNDLAEIAPELMKLAAETYAENWQRVTGEEISGDRLSLEGPSVAAELVIDFIMAEQSNPGTLGRVLAQKPALKERIIDAITAMLRRLGLSTGLAKLEQARRTKEAASAAGLIMEAVGQLKGYAPTAQTQRVERSGRDDNAQESQQVRTKDTAETTDPGVTNTEEAQAPRLVLPRNKKNGEFSNRDLRRRLRRHAEEAGFDLTEGSGALDSAEREFEGELGGQPIDFNFDGPLPSEIRDALSGKNRAVKSMFKGNTPGATGADTMGAIGADKMVEVAQRMHETGDVGLDKFIDQVGDDYADIGMLRVVEGLRSGRMVRDLDPIEVIDEPGDLPDGATFEIEGHEFVVYTADNGGKRASDGQRDFSIQIESMPITKGSLKKRADAEVPEAALDIPFAVRLSDVGQSVFHETRADNALALLPYENTMQDVQGLYVASSPELAIGQGSSRGVLFEFDTAQLEGYRVSKPGLDFTESVGAGTEFELAPIRGSQTVLRDAVRSVTIKADAKIDPVMRRRLPIALRRLEENGWAPARQPDGSVKYTNPTTHERRGIPFAIRRDRPDTGVFGQPTFDPVTGKQNALFADQEQGESELDRELREKAEREQKRIGDDPDQGMLFAVRDERVERGEPLTDFDTPEIIAARKQAYEIEETIDIDTPARRRKRRRVERKLYGDGAKNKDRVAVIVLGPPGAGKSSAIAEPMRDRIGALLIDSDDAKKELPEYAGGLGAMAVHEESALIANRVLDRAIDAGDNIVLPRVGSTLGSIQMIGTDLVESGYTVHVIRLDLPVEETVQRVIQRFREENRFVDPDYVVNTVGENPRRVYNELRKEGAYASYSEYSNLVERGQLPIFLSGEGDAIRVPSQDAARDGLQADREQDRAVGDRTAQRDARTPTDEKSSGPGQVDPDDGMLFAVSPPVNSHKFRKWFGDSKVVDEQGKPLVVYHQTSKENENSIYESGGFRIDQPLARRSDEGVPDGVFLKPHDRDIGLGAAMSKDVAQMPLYASIQNPLIVRDRNELIDSYRRLDAEYREHVRNARIADQQTAAKYDQSEKAFASLPAEDKTTEAWYEQIDIEEKILRDGKAQVHLHATSARARLTGLIREAGYDGVIIENDVGSMGRSTKTIVALEPTQVKSINNSGEFNPENPDIRYAIRGDDAQGDLGFAPVGQQRITPDARPDLANPGRTDDARGFVNTVDQLRNASGDPERVSDDVVEQKADAMLRVGSDAVESSIRQKVERGELLDDVETVAAQRIVNERAMAALREDNRESYKQALMTTDAYRQSGTLAARAFRQRRDQTKGPRERYREAIMGALLEPDARVREQLAKIRDTIMDPGVSDRKKRRARLQQDELFEREADRITKVRKDLAKAGIDPRLISERTMQDPVFASAVVDTARRSRTSLHDALYWVWMNSILSGPLTHAANIFGNAVNLGYRFAGLKGIEAVAGSLHKRTGGDPDFTVGDYVHMWRTLGPALAGGWTNMVRGFATNRQVFDEQILGEPVPLNQIKGESTQLPDAGPRSKVLRTMGLGGYPLKLLMAEDQFFKTIAGVMEAHALAHRQAVREGLTGEARDARITELLAPRQELFGESLDTDIWRQSLEEAKKSVFQDDPSVIGRTALDLRNGAMGPVLKWIIPFVRTPDRLFVRGIESSPIGALVSIAQIASKSTDKVGLGRFENSQSRAADAAIAVMTIGMLAAVLGLKDDEDGMPRITGSRSPNWRDLPEQYRTAPPMSIRIGGKWYSYARIEPLSTGLALTIDMLDRVERGDDPIESLLGSGDTLINLMQDKTFLRSIGQLMEALQDPDRRGELLARQVRSTLITGWVPNLFKQTVRAANPEIVDNRPTADGGFWSKQLAQVPYEALPTRKLAPVPRYDIWGRPIERDDPFGGGAAGFLWRLGVPVNVSDADLHPMDLLVWNYNRRVQAGEIDRALDVTGADSAGEIHPKPPARYFTREGQRINMTAEEYQSMVRNAGERASERLLSMGLDVENPGPSDARRVLDVFKREYSRERNRIYQERRSE